MMAATESYKKTEFLRKLPDISARIDKNRTTFSKKNSITETILGQTRPCLLYENIFYFLKSVLRLSHIMETMKIQ
jgi:hypothetical protein